MEVAIDLLNLFDSIKKEIAIASAKAPTAFDGKNLMIEPLLKTFEKVCSWSNPIVDE
jgi:hypothetical protein